MRVLYHVRHTRPQWYYRYHRRRHVDLLHWGVLIFSVLLLILGSINLIFAEQATAITTTITQEIFPTSLGLSIPSFLFFTPIVSNATQWQQSRALLQNLTFSEERGDITSPWSITATCTDFIVINQPVLLFGINNTLSSGGSYNSPAAGVYIITIIKGGNVGVAQFSVEGLESQDIITTKRQVTIGTRGVTLFFAPAEYNVGDSWSVRIDTIPVSNLKIIPQLLRSSESLSGVTLGREHTLLQRNDPMTIMSAGENHNQGNFFVNLLFLLEVPPHTLANRYTATFTLTAD